MPFTGPATDRYLRDVKARGSALSASEREALLKKYLPPAPVKSTNDRPSTTEQTQSSNRHKPRIRPYLKTQIYILVHLTIQLIFGIYIRTRQIANAMIQKFLTVRHYHHRTPAYIQKDTASLSRLPEHLSVLLKYDPTDDDEAALETLIDEVAELTAWSAAAGIPLLSIYEKSGVLKTYMSAVHELVHQKLVQYFGPTPATPNLRIYAPNLPALAPPETQPALTGKNGTYTNGDSSPGSTAPSVQGIDVLLLSASDGRETLVDLTRTLTEMSQSRKLSSKDITSSLINAEINATTSLPESLSSRLPTSTNGVSSPKSSTGSDKATVPSEPDLLIVFAPYVKLDGYPPWQVRLTEIFCVGDSGGDVSGRGVHGVRGGRTRVEYQCFLRALWSFAGAQMRFGS